MRKLILIILEALLMTWGVSEVFSLNPGNIFSVFIFGAMWYLIAKVRGDGNRGIDRGIFHNTKARRMAGLLSILFTFSVVAIERDRYVVVFSSELFKVLILTVSSVGLVLFFFYIVMLGYEVLAGNVVLTADDGFTSTTARLNVTDTDLDVTAAGLEATADKKIENEGDTEKSGLLYFLKSTFAEHTGLFTFLMCLVCYIPYFLNQYPGIMTPDSIVQFEQVIGVTPYSNHHPWIHTLIMKVFYDLGYMISGSQSVAASFYTFVQMCFMAFSASFVVSTLMIVFKLRINPKYINGICFAVALFYAIVPYNAIFAITVWKDVPFAGIVVIFICLIMRLDIMYVKANAVSDDAMRAVTYGGASEDDPVSENNPVSEDAHISVDSNMSTVSNKKDKKEIIYLSALAVTAVGFCLFRSNGWYAFLVFVPFLLWHWRANIKRVVVPIIVALVIVVIFKYPIMKACGVTQPDFVESLSVPLQQVASVLVNENNISEDVITEIEKVVDLTYIKELYEPTFADNIKELVRAGNHEYLENNKTKFLGIYILLGFRYPKDYLKAYVMQTYGYFYPGRNYEVGNVAGVVGSDLDIHSIPLLKGMIPFKIKEIAVKLGNMIPVYSVLWCIGAVSWILCFVLSLLVVRGNYGRCVYLLPFLFIMLTILIATPAAADFRYAYAMIYGLPLILGEIVKG